MKVFSLALTAVLTFGCAANKPPDLNPEATKAWYGTEIIKDLDRVRDVLDDAHHTAPPLIDAKTDLDVVNWHESAITIVHEAKSGWRVALQASLTELQKRLSPGVWSLIDPYVRLVQNILKEVQA